MADKITRRLEMQTQTTGAAQAERDLAKLEQAAEARKPQLPIITLIDPTPEQYAQAEADYLAKHGRMPRSHVWCVIIERISARKPPPELSGE